MSLPKRTWPIDSKNRVVHPNPNSDCKEIEILFSEMKNYLVGIGWTITSSNSDDLLQSNRWEAGSRLVLQPPNSDEEFVTLEYVDQHDPFHTTYHEKRRDSRIEDSSRTIPIHSIGTQKTRS